MPFNLSHLNLALTYPPKLPITLLNQIPSITLLSHSISPPPLTLPSLCPGSHNHLPRRALSRRHIPSLGLLLPFPLLRRITLRRPRMDGRDFRLQGTIDKAMARERRLLDELRRDDECGESLAASACLGRDVVSVILHAPEGRKRAYRTCPRFQHVLRLAFLSGPLLERLR